MINRQSPTYFERRAEQEQAAAQQAASETAAQRHRELAEQYRQLVLAGGAHGREYADTAADGALPKEFRLIP